MLAVKLFYKKTVLFSMKINIRYSNVLLFVCVFVLQGCTVMVVCMDTKLCRDRGQRG